MIELEQAKVFRRLEDDLYCGGDNPEALLNTVATSRLGP